MNALPVRSPVSLRRAGFVADRFVCVLCRGKEAEAQLVLFVMLICSFLGSTLHKSSKLDIWNSKVNNGRATARSFRQQT